MESVEEAVDVGLGVPVFVAVAGVAEEAVVAEAFQVAVIDIGLRQHKVGNLILLITQQM